jgi:hypothetical protein
LTLFVVPAVYTILDDFSSGFARRRAAKLAASPAPLDAEGVRSVFSGHHAER